MLLLQTAYAYKIPSAVTSRGMLHAFSAHKQAVEDAKVVAQNQTYAAGKAR